MQTEKTNPTEKVKKPKVKTAIKPVKKPKGLWAKIMAVQQNVQVVAKLGFNDFHKYKYAYERDYIAEIKPLLGTEGLVIMQTVENAQERDVQTAKGATENRVTVHVAYTILDTETEEAHIVRFVGQGQDAGDKAFPKALTMANKYFLAKTFQVETGDDAENEGNLEHAKAPKGKNAPVVQNTPDESVAVKFERAKQLLRNIGDANKLLEALEGIKESKIYNAEQKAELSKLISNKLDEIDNKAS